MKRELYEVQFKYKALKQKVEKSKKENESLKAKLRKSYMAQKNLTLEHQEIKSNLDRMSKVCATINGVLQ
jgi:septal ring factor EnvC (AmiA/AmiB activator)